MNHSERVAKYVFETIHSGASAQFRQEQSKSECDFDLEYSDRKKAVMEVTTSTHEDLQRTLANMKKLGNYIDAPTCHNSWLVEALPECRISSILKEVDQYMSVIESKGLTKFFRGHDSPSVSTIRCDLQIYEGFALEELEPPARIFVGTSSENGSIVKADDLQHAIEVEANKKDNKEKLAKSPCAERHLFVHVDQLSTGAWQAMIHRCTPGEPPALPSEITHVWAAAETEGGIIVWVAEPPNGWQDLGSIPSLNQYASDSKRKALT